MRGKGQTKFSIKKRIESLKYTFNGLKILIREEHNARIHLGISIFVIILGFVFSISPIEWGISLLAMSLVLSLEAMNSSIENLCDFVSPEFNDLMKKVKDLSAAAVLIIFVVAIIVYAIIFLPKFVALLYQN